MAPRVVNRSSEDRCEQSQADHELFLQAFEKPTQIYRYLKIRNKLSPTFLNRNLYYMTKHRRNNTRKNFKVDSIFSNLSRREKAPQDRFMTITFLGFYDKSRNEKLTPNVRIELSLLNLTHKKRKDSSSQVWYDRAEVPVNPSESNPPSKAPALSIPAEHLNVGARVKTSTLEFRMHVEGNSEHPEENLEPAAKRRKFIRGQDAFMDPVRSASSELTVVDKHSRLQLTEGEYELIMLPDDQDEKRFSPKKSATWEIIDVENSEKNVKEEFVKFSCSCTLKFRLSWTSEKAGTLVERPRPLMPRENCQESNYRREKVKKDKLKNGREPPTRIVYQFLYNNNSRVLTEAREDLHCPWCSLNCMVLVSLLKHLKLCHPRFLFTYVPMHDGARIDVSVSELFDSSYVGNPHDMISQPQPGYAFSRNGPVQRTPATDILVYKPKQSPLSLSEFLEIEDSENSHFESQRPFVSGHNRLYHNSTTALPIPPHAIISNTDLDEEDRTDPEWLQIKTSKMIDDFTDVNEGEKDFMKIWNNHVQKYTFVGDCQMPQALTMFIEENGHLLIQKGVYRNFILHLVNLFEFGVVGPAHVFTAISRLQVLMRAKGLQHDLCWTGLRQRFLAGSEELRKVRNNFSGIFKKAM